MLLEDGRIGFQPIFRNLPDIIEALTLANPRRSATDAIPCAQSLPADSEKLGGAAGAHELRSATHLAAIRRAVYGSTMSTGRARRRPDRPRYRWSTAGHLLPAHA